MREKFEAWYEALKMPAEADWFKRDAYFPEMYALDGVDAAWDGFEAGYRAGAEAQRETDEQKLRALASAMRKILSAEMIDEIIYRADPLKAFLTEIGAGEGKGKRE